MKLLAILILLLNINCFTKNQKELTNEFIYGNWKCVKLDKRGYQKFTWEKAQKLQSSILTIEKNKFYYSDIDFIEPCNFNKWKISSYDTTTLSGNILDITYKKEVLSKIKVLEPVDDKEDFDCFNDCALFYFKEDTLINICGGYTLFLVKVKEEKNNFTPSEGDTVQCIYKEKVEECTGFVIQGTRKNGKVIHVNPVNKNLPKETVEE